MWLQLFVIFLGLLGVAFTNGQGAESKKKYLYFVIVILILQSGLRNVAVGADTFAYYDLFNRNISLSWNEIWVNFVNIIFKGGDGKGPGYEVVVKLVSYLTTDFQIYLILVATFFFIILGNFIYQNTATVFDVFMALCFYELLFYSFFSITGIRQTIAVGLTLWSYKYIKRRNLLLFLLLVLIAATIHKSSLIFLPFYVLYRLNLGRKVLVYTLISLPFLLIAARPYARFLAELVGDYSQYAESTYEDTGGPNYLIMLLMLAIVSFWRYNEINQMNRGKYRPFIMALVVTIVLAPLMWVDPSLIRVSYYYSIFLVGLFPAVLKCFYMRDSYRSKQIVGIIVIVIAFFIIIRHNSPYAFFWQYMNLPDVYLR